MAPGIWNMIFGALAIGLGLSGKFHLMFVDSPWALPAVGAAIFAYGVYQFVRARRSRSAP